MRLPTVVVRGEVLASWLTISEYTKSRLAAELGVSKGRVSQLLTSNEEPSAHLIAKLMSLTHLPFERLFKIVRESPTAPFPAKTARKPSADALSRAHRPDREALVET
jgi:transcriptional regulator with XRE-family HTH domain